MEEMDEMDEMNEMDYDELEEGAPEEEKPSLDPSRKIKRDILKMINSVRGEVSLSKMQRDYFLENLAFEYAEKILAAGKEDPEALAKMTSSGIYKCQVFPLI